MANKEITKLIPDGFYGFDTLMLDLLRKKETINLKKFYGYWLDIGKPDDYMRAIDDFDKMKDKLF